MPLCVKMHHPSTICGGVTCFEIVQSVCLFREHCAHPELTIFTLSHLRIANFNWLRRVMRSSCSLHDHQLDGMTLVLGSIILSFTWPHLFSVERNGTKPAANLGSLVNKSQN